MRKPNDRPFVVGRKTPKGTTVVLLKGGETAPRAMPGPWTLRAVVTPSPAR